MLSPSHANCEMIGRFGPGPEFRGSWNPRRDALIKDLYERGRGYQDIGRLFGISRQRVHQIVRGYYNHGRQGRKKKYTKKFGRCVRCGSTNNLFLHHVDFDNSNDSAKNLVCLCQTCHNEIHLTST